jgi:hypothetical protein
MSRARYQKSADRFTAFFNRLTKARLSGVALAPALADAIGHELSMINGEADLPPEAVSMWNAFLDRFLALGSKPGAPADPLAKLRTLPDSEAEEAMNIIAEVQGLVIDGLKKAR